MQNCVVKVFVSDQTVTVVKNYSINSVFQKDVASIWTCWAVLDLLHLWNLLAIYPLLILFNCIFPQLLQLINAHFNIIVAQIYLPAQKRARPLDQNSHRPYLSRRDALVKFQIKISQICRLVDLFYLVCIDKGFWWVKFAVSQKSEFLSVLEHGGKLKVVFVLDYFISKHCGFFDFLLMVRSEKRDVSHH